MHVLTLWPGFWLRSDAVYQFHPPEPQIDKFISHSNSFLSKKDAENVLKIKNIIAFILLLQ